MPDCGKSTREHSRSAATDIWRTRNGQAHQRQREGAKKAPGRHKVGDGLFLKVLDEARAYWVYRYRAGGKEREVSIGPAYKVSLDDARAKHARLRARCSTRPIRWPRSAPPRRRSKPPAVPTFGEVADAYLASHEASWVNPKHRDQWAMTLSEYCAPIRDSPVDKVDAKAVLKVLKPLWTKTPETASPAQRPHRGGAGDGAGRRLTSIRTARIRRAGKAGSTTCCPTRRNSAGRAAGHHSAMPYADLPAFMAKLNETPGVAAKALAFTILTAARYRRGRRHDLRRDRPSTTPRGPSRPRA